MTKKTRAKKGIKHPKAPLELQASSSSSKKRNKKKKNLPEDDHDHRACLIEPVLNVKSKKRPNSKKRGSSKKRVTPRKKLRNKMTLEPEASSKNLPEEDQLSDAHDQKTVFRFFEPSPMMEDDNFSEEYENIWNERVVPEGYELSDNHDHDKCIAEQLGLDINRPIPPHYAKYFYNQPTPSPEGSIILSGSELAAFSPFHTPPREASPLPELCKFEFTPRYPPSPSDSDGDLMDLVSNDASLGLGGPMTRSKTKKAEEALYKKLLELEANPDEETAKWLKRLDDLEEATKGRKPTI